jgi:hypothetical protein
MVDDDGMVTIRVPVGTLVFTATADAEVTKAADIQPETKE